MQVGGRLLALYEMSTVREFEIRRVQWVLIRVKIGHRSRLMKFDH